MKLNVRISEKKIIKNAGQIRGRIIFDIVIIDNGIFKNLTVFTVGEIVYRLKFLVVQKLFK